MATLHPPTNTVAEIMYLYRHHAHHDYDGEPVTQLSHMVQAAMLARSAGADDELVLGAFLHDIGHLLKHYTSTESMDNYGVADHEGLGATFLQQRGFSQRVCDVVRYHVAAKRYLVATNAKYYQQLSPASRQTLQLQGGPFNADEVAAFRQQPYFNEIIQVRLWDEGAKDPGMPLAALEIFEDLMVHHLQNQTK